MRNAEAVHRLRSPITVTHHWHWLKKGKGERNAKGLLLWV
jgi:hypothetical protein